tara:strand:- start:55 stop:717 length:663 start_codon:yes stop_codon:yes gene_type:complete
MGKRADKKRLDELTQRVADIVFDRLTSAECRQLIAQSESHGIGRTETLAKFYTTQYSMVCKEMMDFASRHKSENLFKRHEVELYDLAFRAAVGTVYGDDAAETARRLAFNETGDKFVEPGGPTEMGALLLTAPGTLLDIPQDKQASVEVRAHENCCVILTAGSHELVDYFRWFDVGEYLAHESDLSNLLVHYKEDRALSASAEVWSDLFEDRGLVFRPLE